MYGINQLHEVFTQNAFQLTGMHCQNFIGGISWLLSVFKTIKH